MVRATVRQREIAVRAALGAARIRLDPPDVDRESHPRAAWRRRGRRRWQDLRVAHRPDQIARRSALPVRPPVRLARVRLHRGGCARLGGRRRAAAGAARVAGRPEFGAARGRARHIRRRRTAARAERAGRRAGGRLAGAAHRGGAVRPQRAERGVDRPGLRCVARHERHDGRGAAGLRRDARPGVLRRAPPAREADPGRRGRQPRVLGAARLLQQRRLPRDRRPAALDQGAAPGGRLQRGDAGVPPDDQAPAPARTLHLASRRRARPARRRHQPADGEHFLARAGRDRQAVPIDRSAECVARGRRRGPGRQADRAVRRSRRLLLRADRAGVPDRFARCSSEPPGTPRFWRRSSPARSARSIRTSRCST